MYIPHQQIVVKQCEIKFFFSLFIKYAFYVLIRHLLTQHAFLISQTQDKKRHRPVDVLFYIFYIFLKEIFLNHHLFLCKRRQHIFTNIKKAKLLNNTKKGMLLVKIGVTTNSEVLRILAVQQFRIQNLSQTNYRRRL